MKRSFARALLGLAVAAGVGACKINIDTSEHRGSSGNAARCEVLGGGRATVDATVSPGSRLEDQHNAFDGSLSSFAGYEVAAGTGNLLVRGTTQAGTVRRGGVAGVLVSRPTGTQTVRVSISTYLGGKLQDTGEAGLQTATSDACSGTCTAGNGAAYFGIRTSTTYDAIEASVQLSGAPGALEIRELCAQD